jgi:hypothetical protein
MKITIRFVIPIYVLSKESEKYLITEKSFKYYIYLKKLFIEDVIMDFTIIGSEKELSKELTLKYFNEDSYLEFDQGGIDYLNRINYETLNTVVGNKLKYGFDKAKIYNPDLIIIIKSNHFISREWLNYVINDYNSNNNIFYGMALQSNLFILTYLINVNIYMNIVDTFNLYGFDLTDTPPVQNIDACLIAIPKKLYSNYNMNTYNLTEISIKDELLELGGIINNQIENFHIFNIKSKNENTNVTPMNSIIDQVKNINLKNIIDLINSEKDIHKNICRDIMLINNI